MRREMLRGLREYVVGKHVRTISTGSMRGRLEEGGCGECQASCQTACKTSCTVGNQACQKER